MAATPPDSFNAAQDARFSDLQLSDSVLRALADIGYESPSPIQARTIPPLMEGRDVLGQAQTGTGKTAAFALPLLSQLDLARKTPQALVLAPTRELAIQVAEATQKYAAHMPGFHVLPIYGGQPYEPQLKGLKRGAHVVVGTPGRVVDHIKRGSLRLDTLRLLVLDEADEMLRMGFIEDVEWVLQQMPKERQIALFSATMPPQIRRVAQTYLNAPVEISIKNKTTTAAGIRQRYWLVSGMQKLDALTRFLEVETFDAMIVFARTKLATTELADKLSARGYSASALNGDMAQADRERAISKLKDGGIDIIVATDVAARGLDVERISHVVNYDIPTDTESYVHRIGRTGRAGRSGDAILFVSPRERHLLKAIERATRQPIEAIAAPSTAAINSARVQRFKTSVTTALNKLRDSSGQLDGLRALLEQIESESGAPLADIAAALASMVQGGKPLQLQANASHEPEPVALTVDAERPRQFSEKRSASSVVVAKPVSASKPAYEPKTREAPELREVREVREVREPRESGESPIHRLRKELIEPHKPAPKSDGDEFETYRIEVGSQHEVKPANIVGAIANEAGLESEYIGRIEIFEDYSLVELPAGMPRDVFRDLQKVWVCGRQLRISRSDEPTRKSAGPSKKKKPR